MAKKFFRSVCAGMTALKIKPITVIARKPERLSFVPVSKTLAKVGWEIDGRCKDTRVIKPFAVRHPFLGTLTVSIREVNKELDTFLIELKNSLKKVFSTESLMIEPKAQRIRGMNIETAEEYRATSKGRRHGFGELVRLTSIMEMLENKCSSISIFAKNTAVYFHGKYKFQPNITDPKSALEALTTVINDKSASFKPLSDRAKKLYKQLEQNEALSSEQKTLLFKKINSLVNTYIKKALAEGKGGKGHEFEKGMDMILTQEVVQKEKKFFNQRYKRQGIDYKIC